MGQPVVHFEIGCSDSAKTADFFSGLFGWNMQAMGPATMINTGAGSGIHGHITALGHEPRHYTTFYVQVDDVQGSVSVETLPCAGLSGQGRQAGRQDARAAGRDSNGNLRLVCRSGRKHDRTVETEIRRDQAGQMLSAVLLRICS